MKLSSTDPSTPPPATGIPSPPRSWAEIDLGALRHNLGVARRAAGCALMGVVKAGAYGHGLEPIARVLAAEGVEFLGVANVGEARRLADAGITTPIYLLSPTWAEEREETVARGWIPCLSSLDDARHFNALGAAAGQRVTAHLAVDTGMGRGGFLADELPALIPELKKLPHLLVDGLGSHLPSADEDRAFTEAQFARFGELVAALGGPDRLRWRHLANSAGVLGYGKGPCNLARPGLMLYGYSPLPGHGADLRPVMTMKSRVTLVRTLPAGHGVSYGRSFVTTHPTRVATIGVGYGDGYPRDLSGRGAEVVVRDRRIPLLGRVTMDQVMADATGHPDIRAGDEVEVFGPRMPVTEVAAKAGTIAWDVLCRITPRVLRCYR